MRKTKLALLSVTLTLLIGMLAFYLLMLILAPDYESIKFPEGKKFGFTIFDDTDNSTISNIKPVYDTLYELGIFTTKSVWVLPPDDSMQLYNLGSTLSNDEYLKFILDLKQKGFEIGYHGARGISSERKKQIEAIHLFKDIINYYPITFTNHAYNKDNLYWGTNRLDIKILKCIYSIAASEGTNVFEGELEESEYFWGDVAKEHICYVRNFVFEEINVLRINPSMPYHDKKRPFVNYWFSSSDGYEVETFNALLGKENLDRLESEGGLCIVYTHFSGGFVDEDGELNEITRQRLEDLASRNGYFVPVNQMLDLLRTMHGKGQELEWRERAYMQLKWCLEKTGF